MLFLARGTIAYVLSYLFLLLPTYVLPYFGSNSAVMGVVSSALRASFLPMPPWWIHAWCLVALIVLNWMRGNLINKKALAVFPVVAAFFDLTPGLSAIPLVPTVMHLIGLVVGAMGVVVLAEGDLAESKQNSLGSKGSIVVGLFTVIALAGSIFSFLGIFQRTHKVLPLTEPQPKPAIKRPIASSVAPRQVAQPTLPAKPTPEQKPAAQPEVRYIKLTD